MHAIEQPIDTHVRCACTRRSMRKLHSAYDLSSFKHCKQQMHRWHLPGSSALACHLDDVWVHGVAGALAVAVHVLLQVRAEVLEHLPVCTTRSG